MLQGINALVVPQIQEADYAAFRRLIKLLPPDYQTWRMYHEIALRKRGADAVVQPVTIEQFRDHLHMSTPATLAELLRCATRLASREA